MDYLVVIPARYQSSRFPGKPLADIHGKSMIRYVWEKCVEAASADVVLIATDDNRIVDHCKRHDMQVELTSNTCLTGTDRLYEVAQNRKAHVYINVQGDEPLVSSADIKTVIQASQQTPGLTFNAMCSIKNENEFRSLNVPKVVTRLDGRLLYMSRAPIPNNKTNDFKWGKKQVCIIAFPRDVLLEFGSYSKKSPLETVEDLEMLRLLEIGHEVQMINVSSSSIAVDTPEDLDRVRELVK